MRAPHHHAAATGDTPSSSPPPPPTTGNTHIDTNDTKDNDKHIDKETEATEKEEVKENSNNSKGRSVSFNRDVHVKRFGKGRGPAASAAVRREPFTHLSERELIAEANRVLAQADSVLCTADHPPDKFFSLPHRRKLHEDRAGRRNSDDATPDGQLARSNSDVNSRKRRERTSLSTLFRRAQRTRSPERPVAVATKPVAVVKRSKSDVSDLKSNTKLNSQTKPIRKRSGSETEEFLKSLRNKKTQLSPIIESSPRDDYFKKTPPLEVFQKQQHSQKDSVNSDNQDKKINPIEKPPRIKTPEKQEPKPPTRTKRGRSSDKELSPPIAETPKTKTEIKKTLLVDEIDSTSPKHIKPVEIKNKIKESIRKIEENVYADRDMIHSSQQPPAKPPLTRGHAVDHMVRILREDHLSPPSKSHLISSQNGSSNQPFSYIKPSVSPDGNLFIRNSPDRVPSPINRMVDKGVVYAQVKRDGARHTDRHDKENTPFKYSPARDKFGDLSDEDEGLGYEERYKYSKDRSPINDYHNDNDHFTKGFKITDSPIKPKFREFRLTSFDEFEPTYANEHPSLIDKSSDLIDQFRGRGDGMDTKRDPYEPDTVKVDLDFNELSHRRQLLESRLNARRNDREKVMVDEPMSRYLMETDPIYEAEKKMKATERYVNETARYYRHTLERDGFAESSLKKDRQKNYSDSNKYNTERKAFPKGPRDEIDGRDFIARVEPRFKDNRKVIPPEPEYEPPSLESNAAKPVLTPDEYKDKKYRTRKLTSSHDALTTAQRYKVRDDHFGQRKGHYASNPEIAQERDEEYANLPRKYSDTYHNSLRRLRHERRYESPSRLDARLVDSGIEHDFRRDSDELHRAPAPRRRPRQPDANTCFLDSERRHTEDNHAREQIYANTAYHNHRDGYNEHRSRDTSDEYRYEKSPSTDDKLEAKPPKAKKLSGLEKMKQLFSRDSSKKSRKEKEEKPVRTRVLASPERARRDSEYRRYTDPEPESEIIVKKMNYECSGDERRRSPPEPCAREGAHGDDASYRYRSSADRGTPLDAGHTNYEDRYERSVGSERRYQARRDVRSSRYSSERDSDRPDHAASRSRAVDSPALRERYRGRRRLATPRPSPTPSPPRTHHPPAPTPAPAGWFKSLDRLTRKKNKTTSAKVEKESILTTEEESAQKPRPKSKPATSTPSPAKNLRFFGDTDAESEAQAHAALGQACSHPQPSRGRDQPDRAALAAHSQSLSNLQPGSTRRLLRHERAPHSKPPRTPHERARSHTSTLRGSTELRGSRHDVSGDSKARPDGHSADSSTEGDSSHQSQRSVVYLHATTVGDIPGPGRVSGARSRDDVSSLASSAQVRSTTRSFSLLAPWSPRAPPAARDLHYAQRPRPPREPAAPRAALQRNKSSSQSTLRARPAPPASRLSASSQTLHRRPERRDSTLRRHARERTQPSEPTPRDSLSRSLSMPKDKKAGWFKLNSKNKKELNSRVR